MYCVQHKSVWKSGWTSLVRRVHSTWSANVTCAWLQISNHLGSSAESHRCLRNILVATPGTRRRCLQFAHPVGDVAPGKTGCNFEWLMLSNSRTTLRNFRLSYNVHFNFIYYTFCKIANAIYNFFLLLFKIIIILFLKIFFKQYFIYSIIFTALSFVCIAIFYC